MEPTTSLSPEHLLAHAAWIRRLAARLVRESSRADDVAQQTLLEALKRPPHDGHNPRGWLAQVARRVARRMRRSESRRQSHELATPPAASVPAVDDALIRASLQRSVVDAVIALPEPYRAAILLRHLDELPTRRVAQQLGVPVETVRTRLKRGLALLREKLANELDVERSDGSRKRGLAALAFLAAGPRGIGGAPNSSAGAGAAASGAAAAGILGALAMTVKSKLALAAIATALTLIAVSRLAPWSGGKNARSDASAIETGVSAARAAAQRDEIPALAEPTRAIEASGPDHATTAGAAATDLAPRTVTGIVRDETGAPVADAVVAVEPCGKGGWLRDLDSLCRTSRQLLRIPVTSTATLAADAKARHDEREPWCTRSGLDGRFELPAPPATSINVAALHPERGLALHAGFPLEKVASFTTVDIALDPGLIVSGHVTDAQGTGIRGATVMFSSTGGSLDDVSTDESGAYRSLPQPFHKLRIAAGLAGYVGNYGIDVDAPLSEHAHVVDFRLQKAELLLGRVVNSDGTPFHRFPMVAELEVLGCTADPRTAAAPRLTAIFGALLADDGGWTLQRKGSELQWAALFAGAHLLDAAPIVEGKSGPDLVVDVEALAALLPTGTLSITVRDSARAVAIPDYSLEFVPQTSSLPSAACAITQKRKVSAADGAFTTRELLAADWWVTVKAPGFAPRTVAATAVDGPEATPVAVDLVKACATVRGRVVNELLQAIGGASVTLLRRNGEPAIAGLEGVTTSDANGDFEFTGVPEGDLFVVARPPSLPSDSDAIRYATGALALHVSAETAPLTIALHTAVLVRATLATPDASLIGPFSFRILDEQGARLRDDTSPASWSEGYASNNCFRFWVAPGRHVLEVLSRTTKPARLEFVAAPDAIFTVEVAASGR